LKKLLQLLLHFLDGKGYNISKEKRYYNISPLNKYNIFIPTNFLLNNEARNLFISTLKD